MNRLEIIKANISNSFIKANIPIGTIKQWGKDSFWRKVSEGKWEKVSGPQQGPKKEEKPTSEPAKTSLKETFEKFKDFLTRNLSQIEPGKVAFSKNISRAREKVERIKTSPESKYKQTFLEEATKELEKLEKVEKAFPQLLEVKKELIKEWNKYVERGASSYKGFERVKIEKDSYPSEAQPIIYERRGYEIWNDEGDSHPDKATMNLGRELAKNLTEYFGVKFYVSGEEKGWVTVASHIYDNFDVISKVLK